MARDPHDLRSRWSSWRMPSLMRMEVPDSAQLKVSPAPTPRRGPYCQLREEPSHDTSPTPPGQGVAPGALPPSAGMVKRRSAGGAAAMTATPAVRIAALEQEKGGVNRASSRDRFHTHDAQGSAVTATTLLG